jgi:hypothetical protein
MFNSSSFTQIKTTHMAAYDMSSTYVVKEMSSFEQLFAQKCLSTFVPILWIWKH